MKAIYLYISTYTYVSIFQNPVFFNSCIKTSLNRPRWAYWDQNKVVHFYLHQYLKETNYLKRKNLQSLSHIVMYFDGNFLTQTPVYTFTKSSIYSNLLFMNHRCIHAHIPISNTHSMNASLEMELSYITEIYLKCIRSREEIVLHYHIVYTFYVEMTFQ